MEQTDIYTEALTCLKSILQEDHPEYKNWIEWLNRDKEDWIKRRVVKHHIMAYGGMGSFNDLPHMYGIHDYIFRFLKSVCFGFGHLYEKQVDAIPELLMLQCVREAEKAPYHPYRGLNRAIARHLLEGDLKENLDRLQEIS